MKLTLYTRRKKWEFDYKQARWTISSDWVEVRVGGRAYFFPRESVALVIVEEEDAKERKEGGK